MTPDEAIAKIKTRLFNWNGSNIDAVCESELQLAQVRLEHGPLLPWFLLKDVTTLSISAGADTISAPSDFIAEYEELRPGAMWVKQDDGTWKRLTRTIYDILERKYANTTGLPVAYALVGNTYYLGPGSDSTRDVRLIYYAEDATITRGGSENNWLKYSPDLLIGEAGRVIARNYANMPKAAAAFEAMVSEARARLLSENTNRLEHGMNRVFGGE